MSSEAIVTLLVAIFGGGTAAAIIQGIVSHQKGVRDADVAKDQNAIQGFRELTESLRSEVDRLKAAREADSARIDRIEQEISQERTAKWSAIQHIRVLYAWIMQHIPGLDPPTVPDDLAPYVIIPRKDHDT